MRAATETKPSKPRVKSQANVVRVKRDISGASSKDPPKKPSKKERENSLKNNLEKNSAGVDVQTTHAVHRTPILEVSIWKYIKKSIQGTFISNINNLFDSAL